jgi:hypothetical protein
VGPFVIDDFPLQQWENFAQEGQLGYDVTTCKLKVLLGFPQKFFCGREK